MNSLSASRVGLSLLLAALVPAACVVESGDPVDPNDQGDSHDQGDSLDDSAPAGFPMLDRQAMIERFQLESPAPVEVVANPDRGTAAVVTGRFSVTPLGLRADAPARERARAFVDRYRDVFGAEDVAKDLEVVGDETDDLGIAHVTFRQVHEGIEVYGSTVKVHLSPDGEHVEYVSNDFLPGVRLTTTTPEITEEEAIDAARRRVRSGRMSAAPKLFIHSAPERGFRSPRLVWAVDLTDEESHETARHFVDAESGTVIDRLSLTPTLIARPSPDDLLRAEDLSAYPEPLVDLDEGQGEGMQTKSLAANMTSSTYDAEEKSALPGKLRCTNGVCSGANTETSKLDSFTALTMTAFFQDFGRVSYNDGFFGGAKVFSSARYNDGLGPDAYWDGNAERFVYSTGLALPDIVAHEYTHAVTQYSANLVYQGESGALDESFADIFGTYVNSKIQGKDIWTVGAGAPASLKGPCGALRDIANPPACAVPGNPAPKATGNWVSTCSDNGGVHLNAGIVAWAYHLLSSAIGKDRAAKVFYRALVKYLSPSSKLESARMAVWKATKDLYCKTTPNPPQTICLKHNGIAVLDHVYPAFAKAGLDGSWTAPVKTCPLPSIETKLVDVDANTASYKGCYTDQASPRALPNLLIASGATVASCTQAAQNAGYPYAGLQNGGQCWAGYKNTSQKKNDSECNMACTAASAEKCGGSWRNAVWYVPAAASCAHSVEVEGAKLAAGCSPCVTNVCAIDPHCCTGDWDGLCVLKASFEPLCEGADTCAHSPLKVGAKLGKSCSDCVKSVCSYGPYCCAVSWDATCVQYAKTDGNCE